MVTRLLGVKQPMGWISTLYKYLGNLGPAKPERELERCEDDFGTLRVSEQGELRYLYFGSQTEQSCGLVNHPAWLEYDYTRAMLLAGFWQPQASRAVALGLGGGTLVNAVLAYLTPQQCTAVELRAKVVELSRRWFGLSADPRLEVVVANAESYIASQPNSCDLLFVDLYLEGGIARLQLQADFFAACRAALRPGGLLVVNQWQLGQSGRPYAASPLQRLFGTHYLQVEVEEGNIILFIPQSGELMLDRTAMLQWADQLEPQLGYSLRPYIMTLRRAGDVPRLQEE
ncbi:spermidine synthase [Pseudomonas neustonica]|uniref:spermidine synthase n=1 Tax=Pseudomonas TaxID=286 RepID=UPI0015F761B2|nr:methyltransferase domain-containing protein [Pseudomonas sp. 5Ae-yellow]MBA6418829.1 methyltransferase domain-containing protein [Pseudomonas sp. 5Ae-yellow]